MESAPWTAVVARKILMVTDNFQKYGEVCLFQVYKIVLYLFHSSQGSSRFDVYNIKRHLQSPPLFIQVGGIEKQDKIDRFDRSNSCRAALPRGYAHTQTHAYTHHMHMHGGQTGLTVTT